MGRFDRGDGNIRRRALGADAKTRVGYPATIRVRDQDAEYRIRETALDRFNRLCCIPLLRMDSFPLHVQRQCQWCRPDNAPATVGTLGALFIALFVTTYRRGTRGADDGAQILLVLITIAALLLYVAELFRLHDFFGGRHNTVFKFYYEVWIFFAVAGGYGIYYWMRRHPTFVGQLRYVSVAGVFIVTLLIAVSLYYPFAATATKSSETNTEFTLDGLKFLEKSGTAVPEAMDWVRNNVSNDDVIVEASGTSYSQFSRFSGWTGRPTILGWSHHQSQWRGGDEWWIDRERDIERIYNSPNDDESDDETMNLLKRYDANYLIVSPNERGKYTELDVSKFDRIANRVFENQEVIIFALGE